MISHQEALDIKPCSFCLAKTGKCALECLQCIGGRDVVTVIPIVPCIKCFTCIAETEAGTECIKPCSELWCHIPDAPSGCPKQTKRPRVLDS